MSSSDIRSLLEPESSSRSSPSRRAASRRVLEDCWPLLRDAIEPALPEILLQTLGPASRSGHMNEISAARMVMSRDRMFTEAFSAALQAEFKTALKNFLEHKETSAESVPGLKTWSLVDYGEMELSTTIETSSNRMRNAIEETYASVWQRLANLVREPDLRDADNPFRPALLLRAVHAALRATEVKDGDVVRALLQRFEATLTAPLASAYDAINRYFEAKGISGDPDIATIARNTVGAGPAGPRVSRFASGASAEVMLRALYERLGGDEGASPSGAPRQPQPQPALHSAATSAAAAVSASALELAPVDSGPRLPTGAIDPHLLAAIGELQKLGAAALAALKQGVHLQAEASADPTQLRSNLVQKAPRQLDKLTIEIVGLLFDRVNRDAYVPQEVKELIQQLQYPLIKVALVDPELFASNEHPARRLIDRIASTSVGWVGQGEENARYLDAVSQAVSVVLAAEDEVVSAFVNALDAFEAYLSSEHTRDDDPVTRARRALVEAESREIMVINATIKIRRAFDSVQLESYLRDFLLQVWPRVLVAVALREKGNESMHAAVKTYLSIVPDLVWSVQPKLSMEDRKRLVSTIPTVLTVLRQGLTLMEWPKERIGHFFSQLMNSHAQAVKALELVQGATTPVFETSTLRIKLDGVEHLSSELTEADAASEEVHVADDLVRRALADNDAEVTHIAAPAAVAEGTDEETVMEAEVPTVQALLESMKCGQWFVFEREGRREQIQLRWISPHRTFILFTTAGTGAAQSFSADAMAKLIRTGQICPAEDSPLFDRAVKDVLHELRHASDSSEAASPGASS